MDESISELEAAQDLIERKSFSFRCLTSSLISDSPVVTTSGVSVPDDEYR